MLKFVIVGCIFATVSAAPLESAPLEKPTESHITQIELVRPSPINPDIPMDPKPVERIIIDDSKSERDVKSLNVELPSAEHDRHENLMSELGDGNNKQVEKSLNDEHTKKSDDSLSVDKESIKDEKHDREDKRDSNVQVIAKSDVKTTELVKSVTKKTDDSRSVDKESLNDKKVIREDKRVSNEKVIAKSDVKTTKKIELVKTGEPTIVYAVKADEKQRSESFQTSHRIPNIDEGERKFETSHHIPTHIETERMKLIENSKVDKKPLN